jgi:ADP-ribose diphosphatase
MPEHIAGDGWIGLWRADDGVLFVEMQDAALVVPINDMGEVLLVREPSPAYGDDVLVLPGGVIESGESAEQAANRELREEIGVRAELRHLGSVAPMVKYVRARFDVFVGTNLVSDALDDGDEPYEVVPVPTPTGEIPGLIEAGRIVDATAIAALALAGLYTPTR